tara:strand:- start:1728 stop:2240 length:513 start_codon:yes stop_codon:yes gene_type:complete
MTLKHPEYAGRFKDVMGRYRTQSLFREMSYGSKEDAPDPLYTLKLVDPQGELPSLYQLYLDCNDPTEYEFAIQAFGEWYHWAVISQLAWMEEHVEKWRAELEIKMRSEAVKVILEETKSGKGKYNAAKFISDAGWRPKTKGRPSKEEIKRQTKIAAGIDAAITEDLERIA